MDSSKPDMDLRPVMTRVWTAAPPFSSACVCCGEHRLKYTIFMTTRASRSSTLCHECVSVWDNSVPYVLVEHPEGYTECYLSGASLYTFIDRGNVQRLRDFVIKKI